MRIVDYNTRPHELLGTGGDDDIFLKNNATTVVFGGAGDDEIYTPVNTTREQIYGGISVDNPAAPGTFFGHPMPNISFARMRAIWQDDGNDIGHGGNADWMKLGGGADTSVWHPMPGGYTEAGIVFGFNPDEGDTIIFAHDRGFRISNVVAGDLGARGWDLKQVDVRGLDSDPLLNRELITIDFRDDGRGDPHREIIPKVGAHVATAVQAFLQEHDGGHYSPGADDAFIL